MAPAPILVVAGRRDLPHLVEVPNRDSEANILCVLPDALGQNSIQVSQKDRRCGIDTLLGPAHPLDAPVLLDSLEVRFREAGVRIDGEVMLHLGDGIAFELFRNSVDCLRAGAVEVALRFCGVCFLLGCHPGADGLDLGGGELYRFPPGIGLGNFPGPVQFLVRDGDAALLDVPEVLVIERVEVEAGPHGGGDGYFHRPILCHTHNLDRFCLPPGEVFGEAAVPGVLLKRLFGAHLVIEHGPLAVCQSLGKAEQGIAVNIPHHPAELPHRRKRLGDNEPVNRSSQPGGLAPVDLLQVSDDLLAHLVHVPALLGVNEPFGSPQLVLDIQKGLR